MQYFKLLPLLILFLLASCNNDDSNKVDSIESLSIKLENDPHNLVLLENRKALYLAQNNNVKAIADLQHCINIAPDSSKYYIELADLFMENGKANNTLALLEKAAKVNPNDANIWNKVAEIYLLYKKYNEVIKFSNKALSLDKYNDKAFFIKGYAFKELENYDAAIKNFQQCLNNNPNNYNANIELGSIYSKQKNDLAITYYNNAIKLDTSAINAYYNLGLYYQNNDYLNEAISTYNVIIEIDSMFPNSYYNIGYIYLELLKVPDMAVYNFTKAIEANPYYKEAYFNRALCFEEVGNVMQAHKDYKKALTIDPEYESAIEALNRVETTMYETK